MSRINSATNAFCQKSVVLSKSTSVYTNIINAFVYKCSSIQVLSCVNCLNVILLYLNKDAYKSAAYNYWYIKLCFISTLLYTKAAVYKRRCI